MIIILKTVSTQDKVTWVILWKYKLSHKQLNKFMASSNSIIKLNGWKVV